MKFRADVDGYDHRRPLLQGRRQHRHPRRPPVDGDRHAAGHAHLHQRDRHRLAAGDLRRAGAGHRRTRPTSPRTTRPTGGYAADAGYFADRRRRQRRRCTRWRDGVDGAQRRVPLRRRRRSPTDSYQRHQLLGRRRLRPPRQPTPTPPTVDRAVAGRRARPAWRPSTAVTATFSEPVVGRRRSRSRCTGPGGAAVPAPSTYDAATRTATLTPTAPLAAAHDLHGDRSAAPRTRPATPWPRRSTWSFTTARRRRRARARSGPHGDAGRRVGSRTPAPVELGVKFRADAAGYVTGVRFYKGAGNTGTHVGHLWSATGTLLATATFTGETATGWQQVSFASAGRRSPPTPPTSPRTTPRTAATPSTSGFFAGRRSTAAPLHALATGADGGNGVYRYGADGGFPDQQLQRHQLLGRRGLHHPPADTDGAGDQRRAGDAVSTSSAATSRGRRRAVRSRSAYGATTAYGVVDPLSRPGHCSLGRRRLTRTPRLPSQGRRRPGPRPCTTWHAAVTLAVTTALPPGPTRTPSAGRARASKFRSDVGRRRRHRGAVLQGRRQHRHPRRSPLDAPPARCWRRRRSPARRAPAGSRRASPRRCRSPPNTTYVASYYAPNGRYAVDDGYFASQRRRQRAAARAARRRGRRATASTGTAPAAASPPAATRRPTTGSTSCSPPSRRRTRRRRR